MLKSVSTVLGWRSVCKGTVVALLAEVISKAVFTPVQKNPIFTVI